jgi:hypothetical protein
MKLLAWFPLVLLAASLLSSYLFAGDAPGKPLAVVSPGAGPGLQTIKSFAILVNGNDAFLVRIVEDSLALHLAKAGKTVVSRELLEKTVGEQIAKLSDESAPGAINAIDVGKAVHADGVLVGSVLLEAKEEGTLLVRLASFQLIDPESGTVTLRVLFESEEGKTISEMSQEIVALLS